MNHARDGKNAIGRCTRTGPVVLMNAMQTHVLIGVMNVLPLADYPGKWELIVACLEKVGLRGSSSTSVENAWDALMIGAAGSTPRPDYAPWRMFQSNADASTALPKAVRDVLKTEGGLYTFLPPAKTCVLCPSTAELKLEKARGRPPSAFSDVRSAIASVSA